MQFFSSPHKFNENILSPRTPYIYLFPQPTISTMPHVGVELFRHFRLMLSLNTYNLKACAPVISLGVAFCVAIKMKR